MVTLPTKRRSVDEYLQLEAASTTRHEYVGGQIYAMAGASFAHNRIVFNLGGILYAQTRGTGCAGLSSDQRVKIAALPAYYYPDLTIVCGTPELEIMHDLPTLLNPTAIVEVLSPSTVTLDSSLKLADYLTLPSLQHYLLIHQDRPQVLCYTRYADEWRLVIAYALSSQIALPSVNAVLALRELYDGVTFPEPPETPPIG